MILIQRKRKLDAALVIILFSCFPTVRPVIASLRQRAVDEREKVSSTQFADNNSYKSVRLDFLDNILMSNPLQSKQLPTDVSASYFYTQSSNSCTSFSQIRNSSSVVLLDIDWLSNVTESKVTLSRPFMFLGDRATSVITVTQNGAIYLGGSNIVNNEQALPINANNSTIPNNATRIAVAQGEGLVFRRTEPLGGVLFLDTGSSVIISWESLVIGGRIYLSFQVELYDNGNIEMRWKYLGAIGDLIHIASGIEDKLLDVSFPAQGESFGSNGISDQFPGGQCLFFLVSSNNNSNSNSDGNSIHESYVYTVPVRFDFLAAILQSSASDKSRTKPVLENKP